MKKTIITILIISIISTIIIYYKFNKSDLNILSIGTDNNMRYNSYIDYINYDGDYSVVEYYENDMRIIDLINNINNNILIKNRYIKEILINSDITIINIGQNDIKLDSNNIMAVNQLDELIKTIKKINDKNIYLVGLYNPDGVGKNQKSICEADFNFNQIANINNINYIKINNTFMSDKKYLTNGQFNIESHKYIGLQIKIDM